jgi:glycosyltransferase involved in cell wall biosynthesis
LCHNLLRQIKFRLFYTLHDNYFSHKSTILKIVHIAAIHLSKDSGMGRVAWNWQQAFEARGHTFIHIGIDECPKHIHPLLWGQQAYQYFKTTIKNADLILVHEPAAGYFVHLEVPVLVVSHGIEQRGWEVSEKYGFEKRTLKSFLLPQFIRFRSNTEGLKRATKVLLLNEEDKNYVVKRHKRQPSDVIVLKNGYYEDYIPLSKSNLVSDITTFLFNASWLKRKGIKVLVEAFKEVKRIFPDGWHLILAGVGDHKDAIYHAFPSSFKDNITIIPTYSPSEEVKLYEKSDVFILPSYFEGQSLALTQAMASRLCCIGSDNCGQRDFIQHEHNGLLFKTGDALDLTRQIKSVLRNKTTIKIYGEAAHHTVKNLTWNTVSVAVVDLCQTLVLETQKKANLGVNETQKAFNTEGVL